MSFSEKVYRLLLLAYPRKYRDRYAEPMEQLFRDRLRDAHTFTGVAELWLRTLADWAVSVPARYWERASSLDPARRCLFYACCEAHSFSQREIKLEHLLLGILRQDPTLVADPESVVHAIEASEPARRKISFAADLRLSREAARVWAAASAGGGQIAPRDLAVAMLCETDTLAARLLREHLRREPDA